MLFYESADKLRAMNGSGNDGRLLVRQEPVMEGHRFEPKKRPLKVNAPPPENDE